MKLPKLVLTDIDGVWTDGGMYYDQTGNEWKKFNTSDSAGILFLKSLHIPIGVVTGEDTKIVKNRISKLGCDYLFMGVKNKLAVVKKLCEDLGIELNEVAYVGDDLNDIPVLQAVGFSAVPANSPEYVGLNAKHILKNRSGNGVFREFIEFMLIQNGCFEDVLKKVIQDMAK